MDTIANIGEVESASLTVLVDNKADLIVKATDNVKYYTDGPLLAEHGFSVLLQLDDSPQTILWDAGFSEVALLENLQRLSIDPSSIAAIAISHGHLDHYGALTRLLGTGIQFPKAKEWPAPANEAEVEAWWRDHRVPIIVHPAAFRERWRRKDDGTIVGPYRPVPREAWNALGAAVIPSEGPFQLAPGCWTTGYVPRESFEKSGIPSGMMYRAGSDYLADHLEDDQAIVINLRGKGLVVLSGCAHAGIVNTVNHARRLTGVEQVHAVLGGFHLATSSDEEIARTIDYLNTLDLSLVVPSHCTGFAAASRIAQALPDVFVESVAGATFLL